MLLLTHNEQEEKVVDKIISALNDYIQLKAVKVILSPVLSFPGLEIRLNQRRSLQGGEVREDTILINYPLYCPKCRKERLIEVKNLQITVINEPDALDAEPMKL